MTGTQQALISATLEAQMCVHPQNRALPNVFNDGNLAEPLIGTRVSYSRLMRRQVRQVCIFAPPRDTIRLLVSILLKKIPDYVFEISAVKIDGRKPNIRKFVVPETCIVTGHDDGLPTIRGWRRRKRGLTEQAFYLWNAPAKVAGMSFVTLATVVHGKTKPAAETAKPD